MCDLISALQKRNFARRDKIIEGLIDDLSHLNDQYQTFKTRTDMEISSIFHRMESNSESKLKHEEDVKNRLDELQSSISVRLDSIHSMLMEQRTEDRMLLRESITTSLDSTLETRISRLENNFDSALTQKIDDINTSIEMKLEFNKGELMSEVNKVQNEMVEKLQKSLPTQASMEHISDLIKELENVVLKSLGSTVKEFTSQNILLKSQLDDLSTRLRQNDQSTHEMQTKINELEKENANLKQVIKLMQTEIEPSDQNTELSMSELESLSELESHPTMREGSLIPSQTNRDLLELSNQLQAKLKGKLRSMESKGVQVVRKVETSQLQPLMPIQLQQTVKKKAASDIKQARLKPRIRNYNIK